MSRKNRSRSSKSKGKNNKNLRRSLRKKKSKKKSIRKSQKNGNNNLSLGGEGNISGYFHTIKCVNNVCKEYKQNINSFNDFDKLFHRSFIF
jgi:hypothetical protein